MTIYVCRDGQDVGSWPEDEFRDLISRGQILPSDYFYYEGMSDWSLVSTYNPSDQDESAKTAKATEPKPHHDWRLDPATDKQINYLASFGFTAQPGLTKGEASDLIEQCTNDPEALARQNRIRQARYEEETRERAAFPSYYLKADIVRASRQLKEIRDRRNKTKREISTKTKELTAAERKLEQTVNDCSKLTVCCDYEVSDHFATALSHSSVDALPPSPQPARHGESVSPRRPDMFFVGADFAFRDDAGNGCLTSKSPTRFLRFCRLLR